MKNEMMQIVIDIINRFFVNKLLDELFFIINSPIFAIYRLHCIASLCVVIFINTFATTGMHE